MAIDTEDFLVVEGTLPHLSGAFQFVFDSNCYLRGAYSTGSGMILSQDGKMVGVLLKGDKSVAIPDPNGNHQFLSIEGPAQYILESVPQIKDPLYHLSYHLTASMDKPN
jgi:hypothetical protein